MPETFSKQDLQDLSDIRRALPEGDPRIAKLDVILGGPIIKPTASISAGKPAFLDQLEADVRYGGRRTAFGRILDKMGARGLESGVPSGVAETVGGPAIGPVTIAQGARLHDPLKMIQGFGQAMFPASGFFAPGAGAAAGEATSGFGRVAAQLAKAQATRRAVVKLLEGLGLGAGGKIGYDYLFGGRR